MHKFLIPFTCTAGEEKAKFHWTKVALLSIIAGTYCGFGFTLCLIVGGNAPKAWLEDAPGLFSLLFGAVGFPFSFTLVSMSKGCGLLPRVHQMPAMLCWCLTCAPALHTSAAILQHAVFCSMRSWHCCTKLAAAASQARHVERPNNALLAMRIAE
jgi:hypothetical protein